MKTFILITLSSIFSLNAFASELDCDVAEDGLSIACTFTTPTEMEEAYAQYNLEAQNCWTNANDYGEVDIYCFNDEKAFETPTFASYENAPSSQIMKRPEYR